MPNIEWIEYDEVLQLHQVAISRYGGSEGLRDKNLLMSGLNKPRHHCFYEGTTDLYVLASLYAVGIACNHPFIDGNKRTAFQTANFFLCKNGIIKNHSNNRVYECTLSLANKTIKHLDYADFLLNG
jgi:death-on-curing protein